MNSPNPRVVVPIILNVGFSSLLVYGALRRTANWETFPTVAAWITIAIYVAWLLFDARVPPADERNDAIVSDKGMLEMFAMSRLALVLTALFGFSAEPLATPVVLGGTSLFVVGVLFRFWAIRTLGRFYSYRVRILEGHQVVADGPFARIRHPGFLGMLVAHAGFVLVFFTPISVVLLVLVFVPVIVRWILIEDAFLIKLPGYADYASTRRRLIPGVW